MGIGEVQFFEVSQSGKHRKVVDGGVGRFKFFQCGIVFQCRKVVYQSGIDSQHLQFVQVAYGRKVLNGSARNVEPGEVR